MKTYSSEVTMVVRICANSQKEADVKLNRAVGAPFEPLYFSRQTHGWGGKIAAAFRKATKPRREKALDDICRSEHEA